MAQNHPSSQMLLFLLCCSMLLDAGVVGLVPVLAPAPIHHKTLPG
jgi:hypothetical protein